MRSLQIDSKSKKFNLRHARKLHKRNLTHKYKLKIKRRNLQGKSKKPYRTQKQLHRKAKKHPITAPTNLTLIDNPKEFVSFINRLEHKYQQRHEVYIEMKEITSISIDAISVLLSCLAKFKENGIYFEGSYPKDQNCRSKLIRSGFFDYVGKTYDNMVKNNSVRLEGKQDAIITHGSIEVLQALSAEVILEANKHIHGAKRRNLELQSTLIELMTNTCEHASGGLNMQREWWLSIEKTDNPRQVNFSFIDYGVGIFNSLQKKGILQILKNKIMNPSNAKCLKQIFEKEIHKTSTDESYRGKGLPEIKENLDKNSFKNLRVLTNDVYADVAIGEYTDLDYHFNGTFFYFELTEENISYDYNE